MTTTEFCVRCGVRVVFGGEGCPLCGFDSVVSADPPALDLAEEESGRDDPTGATGSCIKHGAQATDLDGGCSVCDESLSPEEAAQLTRLRWIGSLCEAATPGPWVWWTSNSFRRLSARGDGDVLSGAIQRGDLQPDVRCSDADRAFIAQSRTVVPELLAEVIRLRGLISRRGRPAAGCAAEHGAEPMTGVRLHVIAQLCREATPGKWLHRPDESSDSVHRETADGSHDLVALALDQNGEGSANARFIAESREIIPELLAEVARLRGLTIAESRTAIPELVTGMIELAQENAWLRCQTSRERVIALARKASRDALSDAAPDRADSIIDQISTRVADEIATLATCRVRSLPRDIADRLCSLLPARKEWDAERHNRGDIREEDGYEPSDFVDGWNDALDAAEHAIRSAVQSIADDVAEEVSR